MTLNIIEKYDSQFKYASILMNVFIAYQFFSLWSNPHWNDADRISTLAALMAFEFIMVHSGVFMSIMPKKISLYLLFPLYGLFALAFNAIAQDHIILIAYLLVVFNRMRFAFSEVPQRLRKQTILKSVLAAFTYFVLIFPFVFGADYVPELGLTTEALFEMNYPKDSTASGVFVDTPHIAIAFGFSYYCILAIIESFSLRPNFGSPLIK